MRRSTMFLVLAGNALGLLLALPAARAEFFYLSDKGNSTVDKLTSTTGQVATYGSGLSGAPTGITTEISQSLTAFVVIQQNNTVTEVSNGFVFNNHITGLQTPVGITSAFDNAGIERIYVVNSGNGTVAKFTESGSPLNTSFISGLTTPQYVAVDSAGNFYVTDGSSLKIYNSNGGSTPIKTVTGLGTAEGVKLGTGINTGFAFVADAADQTIWKINPTLGTSISFATTPAGTTPNGLAFDPSGNLYITNPSGSGSQLYEVGPTGGAATPFVTTGVSIGMAYDIAQAPEPSSLLLTGLGVGVLYVYRRRRRKRGEQEASSQQATENANS